MYQLHFYDSSQNIVKPTASGDNIVIIAHTANYVWSAVNLLACQISLLPPSTSSSTSQTSIILKIATKTHNKRSEIPDVTGFSLCGQW